MTKTNRFFKTLFMTLFVLVFMAGNHVTAESAEEYRINPVAAVSIGSNGMGFSPTVSYARLVLNVSRPDGTVFSKTFKAGYSPFVNLSELAGDQLSDGSYTYELRVIPQPDGMSRNQAERYSGKNFKNALTQTGAFLVQGGSMVLPTSQEPETNVSLPTGSGDGISGTLDQVFNDDVIVSFSLCVGNDCVNGESFGFDTIRLKENNLRIKFQDTSSSASFPSNDWQITANDSSNGGANKFSIDDIDGGRTPFTLEAGAPSNSLYVDDGGRVGFGTSTPVVDLHAVSGNTPTLRLEQDGSSGFTPQTWDVAGNEANFFVRDATNGSKLPFKIKPGAPTNSLYIDDDGKIGFGTQSPGFAAELETTGSAATFVCDQTDGATAMISAGTGFVFIGGKSNHDFRFLVNDEVKMALTTAGNLGIGVNTVAAGNKIEVDNGATLTTGGVWTSVSSREAKENIQDLTAVEASAVLEGLNPVRYNYKKEKDEEYIGFIAEDVPELVATNDRKGMVAMDVVAVLTKVVKEQQASIAELKKEIAELKGKK